MELKDFELDAFLAYAINVLDEIGIPYMVVGGFAAINYGEPRFTADVDIVIEMQANQISRFVKAFSPPAYYVSEDAIRDSLQRRYPFNVIEPATGAKIDLVPLPRDVFTRLAFQRRQILEYDEDLHRSAYFITPEDIVLAKLMAYRDTGSEKHLRDVRGVLLIQWGQLDLDAIRRGANGAGVLEQLEQLFELVRSELE